MSEKPLLLASAKSGVLVDPPHSRSLAQTVLLCVGILVILIGFASVVSRVAQSVLGAQAHIDAFAPAVVATDPILRALAPSAATSSPIQPARLQIASLGVDALVEAVGTKSDGSMATPKQFGDVAWYSLGSKPGEAGSAVFAGHVNNALTTAGVFEHLTQIHLGDTIVVADSAGAALTYVVEETDTYPADQAPTSRIFSQSGASVLVLITCDGVWDGKARSFDKRFVVYAHLLATH